ncbi:MAG: DUF5522 domain-containing protein [Bdellovibrio sp.]
MTEPKDPKDSKSADISTGEKVPRWFFAHLDALKQGKDFYIDPKTGYQVFTEVALLKKGKCCGSGCRHCPY